MIAKQNNWNGTFPTLGGTPQSRLIDSFNYNSDKQIETNITISKSRLKNHSNKFYLKDQQEFEIEFFNPNTNVYGVKIKLNGNYISDKHLILQPGKRIFLDRYLDSAEKFKFSTYEVESNNSSVENAIKLNGVIEFEFCKENIINASYSNINQNTYVYPHTFNHLVYGTPNIYCGNVPSFGICSSTLTGSSFGYSGTSGDLKETGRIDKGSQSQMKIENSNTNTNFERCYYFDIQYQLLPISIKPIETKDLIRYCTNCGTKSKKEHNFCASCGTKL